MEINIYQVDSFTSQLFTGNPAAVCITDVGLDEATMLSIAAEMAVSETAFLALDSMQLRWFTPQVEVKLCGHGTLAVAHILKQQGRYNFGDTIEFHTLSGTLQAYINHETIELFFPAAELTLGAEIDLALIAGLGLAPSDILDYGLFDTKQLIVVSNEDLVRNLEPDFSRLLKLTGRGVVVTAKSDSDVDVISRYFAPWVGINEDPVTGSAHCALSVYWSKQLNCTKLKAYQASPRGGYVDVEQITSQQVKLSGQAVTVLEGKMRVKD